MPKNTYESQYKKELRRIKAIKRRAEKSGYYFESDVIPEQPKKVTEATIRKMQKIDRRTLFKKGYHLYGEEGEVIPATEYEKIQRSEASKKGVRTRRKREEYKKQIQREIEEQEERKERFREWQMRGGLIEHIREMISNFEDVRITKGGYFYDLQSDKNTLLRIFDTAVQLAEEEGTLSDYEEYLSDMMEEINEAVETINYDSDSSDIASGVWKLGAILSQRPLTSTEALSLEEMADFYS